MGQYINIGNSSFASSLNGEYIDKSNLISLVNSTLYSERRFSCVSRCRRFGKSMAAGMLCAYYDKSCDSRALFANLQIAKDPSFEQHLNKYPVIYLDVTDFTTRFSDDTIVAKIESELKASIQEVYPQVPLKEDDDLMSYLIRIASTSNEQFIFIIDEWDAICREFKPGTKAMDDYVSMLRRMFKGSNSSHVFAGVYMTGILPVKKFRTESALNNFIEYSMVKPGVMAGCFGFTKHEVKMLSEKYSLNFDDLEKWYDGYQIGDQISIFNPNSVMEAIYSDYCESYWGATGSFDAVAEYIQMNYDGLKDNIIQMLAGGRVKVDPTKFQNDISVIANRDDVLTLLIHLGYLSYDRRNRECYIPNLEVAGEMKNAVEASKWKNVADALEQSEMLLKATIDGNEEYVAHAIDIAHDENTSILSYNDENSLACVLSIAYFYAKNDYIIHRELPTGKGFADLVLIPRKHVDSPAIVLELKYNQDADTAIVQIKHRQYPAKVSEYAHNLLLVGINYDKQRKAHECKIERICSDT